MRVKHVACPNCRSEGKDNTGDNLAVFPDGGQFCFSCGYTVSSNRYVPKEKAPTRPSFIRSPIPSYARDALRKFLTDEEINAHFTFDLPLNRAVLIDTLPDFYYGRYYGGGNFKKVFSLGEVPFHIFGDAGETLVVVEDPISAIVVSRSYACLPLFGSHLFNDWLSKLTFTGYRKIVFWLDSDKAHEGLKYALSLRHLYKTGWIHSLQDPKLYSESQVEDFVGGVGKTVNICV